MVIILDNHQLQLPTMEVQLCHLRPVKYKEYNASTCFFTLANCVFIYTLNGYRSSGTSLLKKKFIWEEIFVILGLANTSNCLMWLIKYMLKISSNQSPSTNLLIPNHSILGYFWNYRVFVLMKKKIFFPYQKNKPIFCSPSNTRIPVGVNPSLYSCWSRPYNTERHWFINKLMIQSIQYVKRHNG